MKDIQEFAAYLQEHPDFAAELEKLSREEITQKVMDAGLFASKEEFENAMENAPLSEEELEDVIGGVRTKEVLELLNKYGCFSPHYEHVPVVLTPQAPPLTK